LVFDFHYHSMNCQAPLSPPAWVGAILDLGFRISDLRPR
jgi:hypothetical protein